MSSSAPGEEQLYAPIHIGEKKLVRKGPGGPDGHEVEHEPTE